MNSFSFIGNLGQDAELRFTQSGAAVLTMSVAVTSGWGDNKKTTWVRVNKWGARDKQGSDLKGLAGYLGKGAKVGVTGELSLTTYTNREGIEKSSVDVRVIDLVLLDGKEQSPGSDSAPTPSQGAAQDSVPQGAAQEPSWGLRGLMDHDDDIPF